MRAYEAEVTFTDENGIEHTKTETFYKIESTQDLEKFFADLEEPECPNV